MNVMTVVHVTVTIVATAVAQIVAVKKGRKLEHAVDWGSILAALKSLATGKDQVNHKLIHQGKRPAWLHCKYPKI